MQALWAEPHVKFEGRWHHIDDAGVNPLPISRRIPIWFGGHHDHTLRRIAKWGDGWMMNAYPAGPAAQAAFAKLRGYGADIQRYAYGKIYNAKAYSLCSQMPRFGHAGALTEQQMKDLTALLMDPASPVNQ